MKPTDTSGKGLEFIIVVSLVAESSYVQERKRNQDQ
ncbi:DEAD/DEAH box helicase-like protein [Nitrosococcus halophilus Nc 4]|uniref:DEAD/DEAH box helicase-like protein n=1 Tax=Nitrosococcus halophilus (strain Nc4) TaxID=472759 RepID=D5BY81_NITHN|nr:DEAD/DEAH box helicase-like protein [Nitrosococcus halophilus Nc 4]